MPTPELKNKSLYKDSSDKAESCNDKIYYPLYTGEQILCRSNPLRP